MKVKVQHIMSLPDNEYVAGILRWRGKLIVACESGHIYEVVAVEGDEQYQLICHGFALDTLGGSL